jgi:hypothetical protein
VSPPQRVPIWIRTAVALAAAISNRSPLASVFATRVTSVSGEAMRPT